MSGHFEKGVWIEDLSCVVIYSTPQFQYSYPDIPTQLYTIIEKLAWIERQLMTMEQKLQKVEWDLRWKK